MDSKMKVITPEGETTASAEIIVATKNLAMINDGELMQEVGEKIAEAYSYLADNPHAEKASITLKIGIKKYKKTDALFEITGKVSSRLPEKEHSSATFITKDFKPSKNKTDGILYHSRGNE